MFEPPPFHPTRPSLVRPTRTDPEGMRGPTPRQARGSTWRRTSRGYFVPANQEESVEQRIAEASVLLTRDSAITGWAALRWCGGAWFDGRSRGGEPLPVPLVARTHLATQPGVVISQEFLRPDEGMDRDGLRVTRLDRAVCYEMRHAHDWRQAVVAFDMAAYNDLVSIEEAERYTSTLSAWTGVPQLRKALAHADENSWSPMETLMRLLWTGENLRPRPLTNRPVFDQAGGLIGVPDVIDPFAGLVGEYDGEVHLTGGQRARDLHREARFREVGLEYVAMVAADWHQPGDFLDRLDQAYRRAAKRSVNQRWFTLTAPSWWTDTSSVEARRRLSPGQRSQLLRLRRTA